MTRDSAELPERSQPRREEGREWLEAPEGLCSVCRYYEPGGCAACVADDLFARVEEWAQGEGRWRPVVTVDYECGCSVTLEVRDPERGELWWQCVRGGDDAITGYDPVDDVVRIRCGCGEPVWDLAEPGERPRCGPGG